MVSCPGRSISPQLTPLPVEPFNDDGTWRETLWFNTLNTTYIPLALHAARVADPHTKLYINEYNITGTGTSYIARSDDACSII